MKNPEKSLEGSPSKQLSFMKRLINVYGLKFLIMTSICAHFNKGFGRAHLRQTFKLLMGNQGYKVVGNHFDTLEAVSLMPAALAPAFTLLSEFYPIGGYRKLYYLLFSLIVGTVGLTWAAFMPVTGSAEFTTLGIFLGQFAWMACDSFAQGLYSATMSKHPETGPDLVMFVWIGQQIAGVLAALLSGIIVEYVDVFWGLKGVQWSMALLILPTAAAIYPCFANYLGEEKVDTRPEAKEKLIASFKKERMIVVMSILFSLFALVFAFVGLLLPEHLFWKIERTHVILFVCFMILFSEGFMAYRYLNDLVGKLVIFNLISRLADMTIGGAANNFNFDKEEIYPAGPHFSTIFVTSWCGAAAFLASACALPIYTFISKKMKYRMLYFCLLTLAFCFKLTNVPLYARWNVQWGIGDHLWMMIMTIGTRVAGLLNEMPANLLMSRACPKSLGTTSVAMIGSAISFAFNSNKFVSGAICKAFGVTPDGGGKGKVKHDETEKFDKLYIVALVVCFIKFSPVLFLWLLPNVKTTEALFPPDSDYAKSALKITRKSKELGNDSGAFEEEAKTKPQMSRSPRRRNSYA